MREATSNALSTTLQRKCKDFWFISHPKELIINCKETQAEFIQPTFFTSCFVSQTCFYHLEIKVIRNNTKYKCI